MKIRVFIGGVVCAGTTIGAGGLAAAGGVTGNGEPTDVNGASLCAWSGLNPDFPEESDVRTQSWGAGAREAFTTEGKDAVPNLHVIKSLIGPGTGTIANCRGNFEG